MSELVSRVISEEEIFIRFLFRGNLKRSDREAEQKNIADQNIFLDTRNLGISLQRFLYCDENENKQRAKNNTNPYLGFVVFNKQAFNNTIEEIQKLRPEFKAELISSPLDEELNIIAEEIDVYTTTPINPSHADLIYIDPAVDTSDTSPHTSIRVFSKNLFKKSNLIIDLLPEENSITECRINDQEYGECKLESLF